MLFCYSRVIIRKLKMKDDYAQITRRELTKLEVSKEMLDRVMNYLDKYHFNIYKFIILKEMEITKKDIEELNQKIENDK